MHVLFANNQTFIYLKIGRFEPKNFYISKILTEEILTMLSDDN